MIQSSQVVSVMSFKFEFKFPVCQLRLMTAASITGIDASVSRRVGLAGSQTRIIGAIAAPT